jgi:hypothetical protein
VVKAEVWTVGGREEPNPLSLRNAGDALEADPGQPATTILRHTYVVTAMGGEPFLLKYYAKTYPTVLPGSWRAVDDHERLPLEIVPALEPTGTRLTVIWKGESLPGAIVTVVGPGLGRQNA